MIKFSVVIPLYNKEKDIVNTINSVLNQSYEADEIIVVDDGSTDMSVQLIEESFARKVKVIGQKNMGVASARNKGVLEAKNAYICLIDGDDIWEMGFLGEIAELIKKYPTANFYATAHKHIDEEGKLLSSKVPFLEDYQGVLENFIDVFRKNYGLLNSSSVCIEKSSFVLFPLGEKKGEDICVWLELALQGSLAFSAKPLSIYRLNASNRSATIHNEAIIPCPIKWFYKNQVKIESHKYFKSIKKFIYSNLFITVYGGFGSSKDHSSIDAVIDLMRKNNDKFYLLLYPAHWMPVWFLEKIKQLRRKLR